MIAVNTEKPFHAWKDDQLARDKLKFGIAYYRDKSWYHTAYGHYCQRHRSQTTQQ